MGALSTIKAVALAIANFFGFLKDRQSGDNTPEMQANRKALDEQAARDRDARDIELAAAGDKEALKRVQDANSE